jgi:hypothetical protein
MVSADSQIRGNVVPPRSQSSERPKDGFPGFGKFRADPTGGQIPPPRDFSDPYSSAGGSGMSLAQAVEPPPMALRLFILVAAVACVGGGAAFGALYGVAGLVAVIAGLVLLRRPDVAAIAMISLSPALSGLRRGLPVPGVRISEMLVVSAAVVVLMLGKHERARWNAFDWLFLAYAVGNLAFNSIGAALHHIPLDSTALGVLISPFQFLLIFRVARTALNTPAIRARAFRWIILASVPVSGLAVGQRFGGAPVVNLIASITDSVNFGANETLFTARVTGPFSHWHLLGGYLMVVTLLMVALMMEQHRIRVLPTYVMLPVMALNLTAIILTLTIAIIFGVIAAVVVLALMTRRPLSRLRRYCLNRLSSGGVSGLRRPDFGPIRQ